MVDRLLQGWKIALYDLKYTIDVDPEVLVGNQVSQSCDVGPGNFRRGLSRLRSEVLDGLADNDELKEKGVVQQRVFLGCCGFADIRQVLADRDDRIP